MVINHVIIEGIDRLGKNLLIDGILNKFGFFQSLHYQKPLLLDKYLQGDVKTGLFPTKSEALKDYQIASFKTMFTLMRGNTRILCNRGHLGETVYAKRYRGYDGNYVFDIERMFNYQDGPLEHTLLVLLYTSDFSFITDDGLSLDVTKREEEQADFITAFHKSAIVNKIMIDVSENGKFKDPQTILNLVCNQMSSVI